MLSGWRDAFLDGGTAAMKSRPGDDRDELVARLKAKVGQLFMDVASVAANSLWQCASGPEATPCRHRL
jgi:hypothetical protein